MLQVCLARYWYLAVALKRCYGYSLSRSGLARWHVHHCPRFSPSCLSWCLSWRVVQTCRAASFLQVFVIVLQMEWTQERVIIFIKRYNREEIIWDPQHALHFNKIKKQDAREELAKEINSPINEWKKKIENIFSSLRWGQMTMKHWNRKTWVLLIEICIDVLGPCICCHEMEQLNATHF